MAPLFWGVLLGIAFHIVMRISFLNLYGHDRSWPIGYHRGHDVSWSYKPQKGN